MKILFQTIVGSRLYGFNTEDSDYDFKGFGLPELDELLGLKQWEQTESKDLEKKEEGTIFALTKFVRLSLKGNPTILEVNFSPKECIQVTTPLGEEVTEFLRKNSLTKRAYFAYKNYFESQVKKLQRPTREGKRQPLIDNYGYDVKFASHAYRLAVQCADILLKGTFTPRLEGKDLEKVKEIRSGVVPYDFLLPELVQLGYELDKAFQSSSLVEDYDFEKCNKWLTDIQLKYVRGEYDL